MPGSKQKAFQLHSANRNLSKDDLGGVIFGCNNGTMGECISKQLFGLPGAHFSYVKNIHPGLPLFLFNYSDRKLYGIFEAVSPGNMSIDPYAWTLNGSERTKYPAQVQVRMRQQCQPLTENQFKPIIQDNYYTSIRFCFELDQSQTAKLLSNISVMADTPSTSAPQANARWIPVSHSLPPGSKREVIKASGAVRSNLVNSQECGSQQLHDPPVDHQKALSEMNLEDSAAHKGGCVEETSTASEEKSGKAIRTTEILGKKSDSNPGNSLCNHGAIVVQLADKMRELCGFMGTQVQMVNHLQHKLLLAESEIKQLKSRISVMESKSNDSLVNENETLESSGSLENETENETLESSDILVNETENGTLESTGSTVIENGTLESTGSMVIENGTLESTCSMVIENGTLESNGFMVIENGNELEVQDDRNLHLDFTDSIFLVGGSDGSSWLSSLDLYTPSQDVLNSLRPMSCVRSHTAVVELIGELYVLGGGDGFQSYDTVESYNLADNIWSVRPSLNEKKFHLAGATLDNKIFAMGGNDDSESLSCVEMYDINVGRWIKTRSMRQKRSALSAAELNGALYVVGGYDGNYYLHTAERFDPREHSWCQIEGMNTPRGGHSLVVMNEKLYALGGYNGKEMTPSVEIYDPRLGFWLSGEPMNQFRGNAAAAVLNNSIYMIGGAPTVLTMTTTVERYVEGQGWELVRNFQGPGTRLFSSAIVAAGDSN